MTTRGNAVRPAAHRDGQLYTYFFAVYRDNGPRLEMTFLRASSAQDVDRWHALQSLPLAANERAVRAEY